MVFPEHEMGVKLAQGLPVAAQAPGGEVAPAVRVHAFAQVLYAPGILRGAGLHLPGEVPRRVWQ